MLADTTFAIDGVILPDQFYGLVRRSAQRSGELRLLTALLEDAMNCFLGRCTGKAEQKQALQQEAVMWISGKWAAPFSFELVCEVLGIDPDFLRVALFRLYQQNRDGTRGRPWILRPAARGPCCRGRLTSKRGAEKTDSRHGEQLENHTHAAMRLLKLSQPVQPVLSYPILAARPVPAGVCPGLRKYRSDGEFD
jgi:hypothetical protein